MVRSKRHGARRALEVTVGVAALFLLATPFSRARAQSLRQIAKFDLPGPAGKRFDYLTIDEDDQFLYRLTSVREFCT